MIFLKNKVKVEVLIPKLTVNVLFFDLHTEIYKHC